MATPNENAIKSLETIAAEGWIKIDSPSDYAPTATGYLECSPIKKCLDKNGIECRIVYDSKTKTQNKFNIYVPKDFYEKANEIAKRVA